MQSARFVFTVTLLTAATAFAADNGYIPEDKSTWDKMFSFLMATASQTNELEKGECGDYCYVINGKVRVVLEHGEEYRDPDQPCDVYSCIGLEGRTVTRKVTTTCVDPVEECPEAGQILVQYPEQCCAECQPPKKRVDKFTSWSEWTECSKTCGGGSQARSRKCLIDETGAASNCGGGLVELRNCHSQPCPIPCVWKQWSAWHGCSVTCGGGTQQRTRQQIPAQYQGKNCEGPSIEKKACHLEACQDPCPAGHTYCDNKCVADKDHDCILDVNDNCPDHHNFNQADYDEDGIGDACDNCEHDKNEDQSDNDKDNEGDMCDNDDDNDNFYDDIDNCKFVYNPEQHPDDVTKFGDKCNTPNNGALNLDELSQAEKEGLVSQIMEKLIGMYYSN